MQIHKIKKILFLDHGADLGGAQIALLSLLKGIDRNKFKCWLACPKSGDLATEAKKLGINIKIIHMSDQFLEIRRKKVRVTKIIPGLFSLLIPLFKLYVFVKQERFDIIYTNSMKAHLYGSIIGFLTQTPIVWRMNDVVSKRLFNRFFIRLIVLIANIFPKKIICVSHAVKASLIDHKVHKNKLSVVYNGTDPITSNMNYSIRKELGLPSNSFLVCWVGRLTPLKGPDVFLKAAAQVLGNINNNNVYFVIVGDTLYESPDYKEKLTELCYELGMGNRFFFTGFRKDVHSLLAQCDIFVHTSVLPEAFGMTLIEAASYGKAIIASDIGAVSEILKDGEEGILTPPNDPGSLAQAIVHLIRNKDQRCHIGEAAKKKVLKQFSTKQYVDHIEKILEEI